MKRIFLAPGQNGPIDQDYAAFKNNFVKISDNVFLTKMPAFLIFFQEEDKISKEAVVVDQYSEALSLDDAKKDQNNIYFFIVNNSGVDNKRYYKLEK